MMTMINSMFVFAPCILSMFAIVLLLIRSVDRPLDWWMLGLLVLLTGYFMADAWFFTGNETIIECVRTDISAKAGLLFLLPTAVFWYRTKMESPKKKWYYYLVYLMPVAWLVAVIFFYSELCVCTMWEKAAFLEWDAVKSKLIGCHAGLALWYMGQYGFLLVLAVETVIFLGHFLTQFVRLTHARPLKSHKKFLQLITIIFLSVAVIVSVRFCIGLLYLHNHPSINSVFYALFSLALILTIYMDEVDKLLGDYKRNRVDIVADMADEIFGTDKERFDKLLLEDGLCYSKGLSEDLVCKELGTNRTYLGKMVKTYYDMSFTAWVMECRVEHSKKLMLENPDAKLLEIAEKCGFADDSVFSRSFSKVTGMTPREWYLKNK